VDGYDIGKAKNERPHETSRLYAKETWAHNSSRYTYQEPTPMAITPPAEQLEMIDTVKHDILARYPQDFEFATTAGDIEPHSQDGVKSRR